MDEIELISEAVIKAVRDYDRERHSQAIKYGMAVAKLRGKRLGRPSLDDETARQVVILRAANKSIRQIMAELEIGSGTVQRVLRSAIA